MRCFYCGSQDVALITRNDGYSMKKGIVGTALLGPVGAVAGINGKNSEVYHCSACGQDSSMPMDAVTEGYINKALSSNDTNERHR